MYNNKKLQSAVELISTYSFAFIVIALAIVIVVYLATPLPNVVPAQCNSYGGIYCIQAGYLTNTLTNSANVIIYISNSGSNPANVLGANVVVNGLVYIGSCNPAFVVPGANTLCLAPAVPIKQVGEQLNGKFLINVQLCNSGVPEFSFSSCTFTPVSYAGSFIAYTALGATP